MKQRKKIVREYLRVSQDRRGTGKSPTQQHEANASAIEDKGWVLHPKPYQDEVSASRYARRERVQFNRLLADLEDDTFGADILAIWESSRGSRRAGEWITLIELCEERSVVIWVTTHGREYDPKNSRDRRSLLEDAVDSEYESAKTSERILRDVRAAAEKGRPHGKQVYGYLRIYNEKSGILDRIEPHPEQAAVVQEAAKRVLNAETFYSVAKDFNQRGIPVRRPPRKTHRENLGWTPPAVKQMLTMPAYAGLRQYQGQIIGDAMWPALIDREKWEKLQGIMSPPERKRTNDWPSKHLLSGIALCGVCGATCRVGKQNAGRRKDKDGNPLPKPKGEDGNELPYPSYSTYLCAGIPGKSSFHVAMREEHLDQAITEAVLHRLEQPGFLAKLGQQDQGVDAERQTLLDEIEGHHKWLTDVHKMAEAKRDLSLLSTQEVLVQPKIEAAQRRLETLADTDPLVLDLASSGAVREAWEKFELADKRRVIRALVTPRVNQVPRGQRGRRGINSERIDVMWR